MCYLQTNVLVTSYMFELYCDTLININDCHFCNVVVCWFDGVLGVASTMVVRCCVVVSDIEKRCRKTSGEWQSLMEHRCP